MVLNLIIQAAFNNAAIWMVTIFNSPNLLFKTLETTVSVPTTIVIIVTLMFHRFLTLARCNYLSIIWFILTLWSARTAKSIRW